MSNLSREVRELTSPWSRATAVDEPMPDWAWTHFYILDAVFAPICLTHLDTISRMAE